MVCGCGVKGRVIVDELRAHGHPREQIVAIDADEDAVAEATKVGLVALRGDASREELLRAAAVEKAAYVLVAPNRDDACVLMCLTVRSLAPSVHLVAAAREEENVKLLYGAGADLVSDAVRLRGAADGVCGEAACCPALPGRFALLWSGSGDAGADGATG